MEAAAPSGPTDKLSDDRLGEPSEAFRQWVEAAREIQQARFEGKAGGCEGHPDPSPAKASKARPAIQYRPRRQT